MILYPAIDLKDGVCVRLRRGIMEDATIYNDDPAAQATHFKGLGFSWLHIVDLNGAFAGRPVNADAVSAILGATDLPVQLGGGIRDLQTIQRWVDRGVARVVLGTVEGDLHEIGKTLVGTMLTANGFQVTDIGVDKTAAEFIDAMKESGATLIGASALLTTTMLQQQKIIDALEEAGLREQVKVLIGGAPVTETWAEQIGADGYAEDAISAVAEAKRLASL